MSTEPQRRILVIDDNEAIHADFRKILCGEAEERASLEGARAALFGGGEERVEAARYELESALGGEEGIRVLHAGIERGQPFSVAFVDCRMPPGIDGVQTVERLWAEDPDLQIVLCTAYADYSFEEITSALGATAQWLILKKPFDPVEVAQLANALSEKWATRRRERARMLELERASAEARAASDAKSAFLANMSHEIRTPMAAILGYADLLGDEEVSQDVAAGYRDIIRTNGQHLLTILNDVLDISKIEAGRMELAATGFSPWELCTEVVSLLRAQAREKGLDLSLVADGPLPREVETDPVRLRQILLNLVGNAVKFTHEGEVRLVVRFGPREGHPRRVLTFDVVDTGVGLSLDQTDLLFQPFSQADASSTRVVGGTGLGLAISKRLANILGGDVGVQSEVGQGSTFTLWIDVGEPGALETVGDACPDPGSGRPPLRTLPALRGRVLVVDDVPLNQRLISTYLERAGAEVTLADNGLVGCEAFEAAAGGERPFELVLMDMQMPVLDGYDATRRLRAGGFDVPVVALTAHALVEERGKCLAAGCTEYVTKPVDRKRLIELCARWIGVDVPAAALPGGDPGAPCNERSGATSTTSTESRQPQ